MDVRPLLPADGPLGRRLEDWYDDGAPSYLRAGFVVSVDGAIAADASSLPLSGPSDRAVFAALRTVSDAVLVGAGTVRRENYGPVRLREGGRAWRGQHARVGVPPLVVLSRRLDLDPAARCFGPGSSTIVVTCEAAPAAQRDALREVAEVVVAGADDVDLTATVAALADRGLRRVLCEGGPTLLTALLRAGLVDELCLTLSPMLVGAAPGLLAAALPAPVPVRLEHLLDAGDGVLFARYLLR